MAPNLGRFALFLQTPHASSPYSSSDDLGTRGAVWAFLRYAADRRGSGDGDVWMRLVNSPVAGFDNLRDVFGPGVHEMLHDWTVSVYTDDNVAGIDPAHAQASWDFRTVYPAMPTSPRAYPLATPSALSDGIAHSLTLRGGSGAFLRFGVLAGREAAVHLTSDGMLPPLFVLATIVRTR
jgi:hypothetical protein